MITEAFGHWLAGFIDGEGYFGITQSRNFGCPSVSYRPKFKLGLRADDRDVLVEIVVRTEIGRVDDEQRPEGMNPVAVWNVSGKQNCLRLVDLLDRYPLRAKKRHDFVIWRSAVLDWQRIRQHGRQSADWTTIAEARGRLMESRRVPNPLARLQGPIGGKIGFEQGKP